MVEQDRPCPEIIIQVASVQQALRGVARELMRNHLRHCAKFAAGDELLDLIYKHLR
jgi:DNA-binding FrmR family transcriptional regulator